MISARLLKPKRIVVRPYAGLSHAQMIKVIRSHKVKKYRFLEVAYEVDQVSENLYDVRMEYTAKD